jgi:DnaJ-class molecular chaperone|tara:strand:+ start:3961 stop:4113 length:153 start_codon:yes stop_codon:yes gene_type:complete
MSVIEVDCKECDGSGKREHDVSTYTDITPQYEYRKCEECDGSGTLEEEED